MKDWILENKFISLLLGIFAAVSALIGVGVYFNISEKAEIKKKITTTHGEITGIKNKYGNAKEESFETFKNEASGRVSEAIQLYQGLSKIGYKDVSTEKSDTDFAGIIKDYADKTSKKLSEAGITYSGSAYFGFEKYREGIIVNNPKAIGMALYQKDALEWLFDAVVESKPVSVDSFYRNPLVEESQERAVEVKTETATRRMSLELGLTMDEHQFSDLMSAFTNSDKYIVAVRSVSLINEKPLPSGFSELMLKSPLTSSEPSVDNFSGFDTVEGGGEAFGSEVDESDEGEQPEVPKVPENTTEEPAGVMLGQILGDEKLKVNLLLDLIYFYDPKNVPIQPLKSAN